MRDVQSTLNLFWLFRAHAGVSWPQVKRTEARCPWGAISHGGLEAARDEPRSAALRRATVPAPGAALSQVGAMPAEGLRRGPGGSRSRGSRPEAPRRSSSPPRVRCAAACGARAAESPPLLATWTCGCQTPLKLSAVGGDALHSVGGIGCFFFFF